MSANSLTKCYIHLLFVQELCHLADSVIVPQTQVGLEMDASKEVMVHN